jgi:pimeloyl-ACP methyl ester carboxylesterase
MSIPPSAEAFAAVNGVELCYQTFGSPRDPPLLLIMGLGAHMIQWDDEFCSDLAERGLFVIRFDNRDVGRSTKIEADPAAVAAMIAEAYAGRPVAPPYRLVDMARDALGLLDALGVARAHIVGASMGGGIAQVLALLAPERALSLTSIMSSTGERDLPPPGPEFAAIFLSPPPRDAAEYVEANLRAWALMRAPGYDDPAETRRDRERAERAAARAPLCPEGGARQMLATLASGGRRARLAGLHTPTLVIHGTGDRLTPLVCGEDVARAIPGARLLALDGMGHNLPKALWPQIVEAIASFAAEEAPSKATRIEPTPPIDS